MDQLLILMQSYNQKLLQYNSIYVAIAKSIAEQAQLQAEGERIATQIAQQQGTLVPAATARCAVMIDAVSNPQRARSVVGCSCRLTHRAEQKGLLHALL